MPSSMTVDLLIASAFVVVAGVLYWKGDDVLASLTDSVNRDGYVPTDPKKLAAAAGVPLDQYALARMAQSEESGSDGRLAVMFAALNYSRRKGQSVSAILLRSTDSEANGFFGQQGGRYAATSKRPAVATIALAGQVLAGAFDDPTGGAEKWDAPETQRILHEREPEKYKTPEEVAAIRKNEGYRMVWVDGVSSTRFWVRA